MGTGRCAAGIKEGMVSWRNESGALRGVPPRCRSGFSNRSEQLAICTLMERFPGQVEPVRLASSPDFSFELPDVGQVFLEVTSTDDKSTGYTAINEKEAVPIEQYQRKAHEAAGYVISRDWSNWKAKKLGHLTLRDVVQRKAKDKIDREQFTGCDGQRWLWNSLGWGTGREIERAFEHRPGVRLVARRGPKTRPHFAHHASAEACDGESLLHRLGGC